MKSRLSTRSLAAEAQRSVAKRSQYDFLLNAGGRVQARKRSSYIPESRAGLVDTEEIAGEDFGFKVGEQYLVYAFGENENLATTECERTTKLEKADEDLKALGEGRLPEKKKAKVSLVTSPPNNRLQRTGISVPLIDNLPLVKLSPGR